MLAEFWFEYIPLWGVFLLSVGIVLLSISLGTLLGKRRREQLGVEVGDSIGPIVGAMLGLLSFMLAFTFGYAADVLLTRKQLLLDEVNAISTTFLRADMLLEPHREAVRRLLREYVDLRADVIRENLFQDPKRFDEALSRSERLLDQIWSHADAMADADRRSMIDALFINSLNHTIDLYNSRVTVARYHIPTSFWNALFFITMLTMGLVGYQAGLLAKSSLRVGIILALTFSAVILLIADLDRVAGGRLYVQQQPMLELQKKMQPAETEARQEQIFSESAQSTAD